MLARAMVKTACFQSIPRATRPEARVQLGMQWAMEIHSAAKLYVVHLRSETGTGRRSSLAKGLSAGNASGASSIRPEESADWAIDDPEGTVSVMGRPIRGGGTGEKGRAEALGPSPGTAGEGVKVWGRVSGVRVSR